MNKQNSPESLDSGDFLRTNVGDGALDIPSAVRRQFAIGSQKYCAFSGRGVEGAAPYDSF